MQGNPDKPDIADPSEKFKHLKQNVWQTSFYENKSFLSNIAEFCDKIANENKPDSIIDVNILEHIEDASAELLMIWQTLKKGGRCYIFVPALSFLYGEFDRKMDIFVAMSKKRLKKNVSRQVFVF